MIRPRKTYSSCSELPLYNFIKIVCKDDLNWLYAEKKSLLNKNVELQGVWEDIFAEYTELTDSKLNKQVFALTKEITVINNKLEIIQNAVNYLYKHYDVRLCDMLRRMGFRYPYTEETLHNDLKLTISSAKRMIIRRQEAENDYQELNKSEKKVTEDDYLGLIRQLSRFNGFPINPKTTSVTEFVKDINAFNIANTPKDGK